MVQRIQIIHLESQLTYLIPTMCLQEMEEAIENGDLDQVQALATEHLNFTNEHGTVLHMAVRHGHTHIVQWLIQQKEWDYDQRNANGRSLLHLGVLSQSIPMVAFLLSLHVHIDPVTLRGFTPLHCACRHQDEEMIHFLLDRGSSAAVSAKFGLPIHCLLRRWQFQRPFRCSLRTIQRLLDCYPPAIDIPTPSGRTLLHMATTRGCLELVHMLLNVCSPGLIDVITNQGTSALHMAVFHGHCKIVRLLIQRGSRMLNAPDEFGYHPIHVATIRGHLKMVKEIISHLEDASTILVKGGRSCVHMAALHGYDDILRFLVDRFSLSILDQADDRGRTAMHMLDRKSVV